MRGEVASSPNTSKDTFHMHEASFLPPTALRLKPRTAGALRVWCSRDVLGLEPRFPLLPIISHVGLNPEAEPEACSEGFFADREPV